MANLLDQIKIDLKEAMKAKEELRLSVLRMMISVIRNKEISLRKGEDVVLSDEQILEVLSSEVKKRKDSIESYKVGNREDLVEIEKNEIDIIAKYLPAQMSEEELEKIVEDVMKTKSENSTVAFGAIMGEVMARVKGKADGTAVSAMVKKKLG
ncbi:MAG: GatB/YqeY domain-containing protein [Patescibacteria group bacterium]|jgi:uncharacterized protein YqeY|nr:GatB/YqeY domain-containing protein [Patescibacteria group bacterium]